MSDTYSTTPHNKSKFCNKCKTLKPLNDFGKDQAKKDGLSTICLECRRVYDRERSKTQERKQRSAHFARNNREYFREYERNWRQSVGNARRRKRYATNEALRQKDREHARQWRLANPEKRSMQYHRRKARMKGVESGLTSEQRQYAFDYFDNRCAVCGTTAGFWTIITLDHWIPLSKSGSHTVRNVVPMCHTAKGAPSGTPCCNNSKHDKAPEIWLEEWLGKKEAAKVLKRIKEYFDSLT